TEMLYRASNERYDTLLEDLHRVPQKRLNAVNDGNPLAMFQMLKFEDLSILASTAKDWFSN
ncbi:NAD(P)/FAD-dependent oxidoreductase, partial [Halobellus sp. Atlit-38R]